MDRSQIHALMLAAQSRGLDGDFDSAQVLLERVLDLDPSLSEARYLLSFCQYKLSRPRQAIANAWRVIRAASGVTRLQSLTLVIDICAEIDDWEVQIESVLRFLSEKGISSPDALVIDFGMANLFHARGRFERAREHLLLCASFRGQEHFEFLVASLSARLDGLFSGLEEFSCSVSSPQIGLLTAKELLFYGNKALASQLFDRLVHRLGFVSELCALGELVEHPSYCADVFKQLNAAERVSLQDIEVVLRHLVRVKNHATALEIAQQLPHECFATRPTLLARAFELLLDRGKFTEQSCLFRAYRRLENAFKSPFMMIASQDAPCSTRIHSLARRPANRASTPPRVPRVGVLSADLREHAVGYLTEHLWPAIGTNRFELVLLSLDSDDSRLRREIERSFVEVHDLKELSTAERLRKAKALGLDICLDMMGHTLNSCPKLLEERVATVQINYLGYPGSTYVPNVDYIYLDRFIANDRLLSSISETAIIPGSVYQPGWGFLGRKIRPTNSGFKFVCFNSTYKINFYAMRAWSKILRHAEGATLTLLASSDQQQESIASFFQSEGVGPDRLFFLPFADRSEHLKRLQEFDLFLDTFPYGAHTTARDALSVGLPVLTRYGFGFASRVCASLNHHSGLDYFNCSTFGEYIRKAVFLSGNLYSCGVFEEFSEKISQSEIFNSEVYVASFEKALRDCFA